MRYVVGYRGFEIVRESPDKFFQIFKDGKLASPGKFWTFTEAREECDYLKGR